MDIIPNKKSNLLYQKGDQKTKGVIDLRCFAEKKKIVKIEKVKNKIVSEIIRKDKVKKGTKRKFTTRLHRAKATMEPTSSITKPQIDQIISQHPNFLISKKYRQKKIPKQTSKQKGGNLSFRFKPSLLFQTLI